MKTPWGTERSGGRSIPRRSVACRGLSLMGLIRGGGGGGVVGFINGADNITYVRPKMCILEFA